MTTMVFPLLPLSPSNLQGALISLALWLFGATAASLIWSHLESHLVPGRLLLCWHSLSLEHLPVSAALISPTLTLLPPLICD